jgi:hypothetical protein
MDTYKWCFARVKIEVFLSPWVGLGGKRGWHAALFPMGLLDATAFVRDLVDVVHDIRTLSTSLGLTTLVVDVADWYVVSRVSRNLFARFAFT